MIGPWFLRGFKRLLGRLRMLEPYIEKIQQLSCKGPKNPKMTRVVQT